jgi:hypothetical protein
MKLKSIGPNCHELQFGRGSVLFSYETPVAVALSETVAGFVGVYKTQSKFSKTTSKHINNWTGTNKTLPQNVIENLSNLLAHETLIF